MLGDRNARLFVGVSLVSGFGATAMSLVASVWMLSLTGSAELAALMGMCIYVPSLAGPVLGAFVDRLPKQKTLVWTCLIMAATLLLLLAVRSAHDVWLLFLVMLCRGVSYVVLDAADSAILPLALPQQAIGQVNGLRMGAQEGIKLVAPLAGAGIFAWTGNGQHVAGLAAFTLGISAWLYATIRPQRPAPAKPQRLTQQIRLGAGFLWRHPLLRLCVALAAIAVAMSGLGTAATYVVVIEDLHQPPAFLGVLASAQGAGAIAGGVAAGWMMRRVGERATAVSGIVLFAAATLSRCIVSTPLAVAASVVIGIGLPWTVVAAMTAVQRTTPPGMLGSVAATASTLVFAPIAVATAIGATPLAVANHRLTLVIAAVICLLSGLLAMRRLD